MQGMEEKEGEKDKKERTNAQSSDYFYLKSDGGSNAFSFIHLSEKNWINLVHLQINKKNMVIKHSVSLYQHIHVRSAILAYLCCHLKPQQSQQRCMIRVYFGWCCQIRDNFTDPLLQISPFSALLKKSSLLSKRSNFSHLVGSTNV